MQPATTTAMQGAAGCPAPMAAARPWIGCTTGYIYTKLEIRCISTCSLDQRNPGIDVATSTDVRAIRSDQRKLGLKNLGPSHEEEKGRRRGGAHRRRWATTGRAGCSTSALLGPTHAIPRALPMETSGRAWTAGAEGVRRWPGWARGKEEDDALNVCFLGKKRKNNARAGNRTGSWMVRA
jgi:hypothetical protein